MNDFMNHATEKTIIGLCATVFNYIWINNVTSLLFVLAMLIMLDFITGFVAGIKVEGYKKNKVRDGALAKVGIIGIITLAFLGDFTLFTLLNTIGINIMNITIIGNLPLAGMLGFAVCIYFIGSEGYSSLQNLLLWGTKGPDWLLKIFSLIRDAGGKIIKVDEIDNTIKKE